jgi:hypothetical protein
MKKLFVFIAPLVLSTYLFANPDEPSPPEDDNVTWHSITMIDYKPGTNDEVKAMIQKFESASEKAGTALPELYWFESGKYDLVLTWKLKEGITDFQGKWSPYGEPWWKALVEQEGSEEAASKLQADYNNLVDSSVTSLARRRIK